MKWIRRVLVLALLLLAVFGASLVGVGIYLSPQDPLKKADAIVAISGGETPARVREASQLYREGYAPIVIFSGAARSGPVSNALSMARIAERQGVPADAIILEEHGATTAENASRVAEIVRGRGLHSIILVTSPYHQRRASLEFHRALKEAQIINRSATDSSWRRNGWWSTADGRALTLQEIGKVLYINLTGKSGTGSG